MKLDMFSMTQGSKRTWTYLSQAVGLMADLDLGTEHLRWMGDARFMYGFVRDGTLYPPNVDIIKFNEHTIRNSRQTQSVPCDNIY